MSGIPKLLLSLPIAIAATLVMTPRAAAELLQYEIQIGTSPRLITFESVVVNEVAYAPLEFLIEQAGGSYNVLPTRLRVDLGGSTAWLRAGESRVHALSIFSLSRPIAEDASGVLIAVDDIPDFFLKSFRIIVRPFGAQPPAPTAIPPTATPAAPETPMPPEAAIAALEKLGGAQRQPGVVTAIVIDAGHGGYDTGIQSSDRHSESVIVLAIAKHLKSQLDAAGGPGVILTRPEDVEISSQQRLAIAQSAPGALFVSIHAGSSLSPAAEGVAVLYPAAVATTGPSHADALLAADSRRLAEAVAAATTAAAGVPLRGVVQAPLKLLGELQVPAIQIEVGCLTSVTDSARFASDEHLTNIATGIFNGITMYLSGQSPSAAPSAAAVTPEVN